MPKSFYDIYAAQLSQQKEGYPLWCPEPADYDEVKVGDVGYLWRGSFIRLFNATLPSDHPDNIEMGVPNSFHQLHIRPRGIRRQKKYFDPGTLRSHSVREFKYGVSAEGTILPGGAGIHFSCSDREGAVLVLSRPGDREDATQRQDFEAYIRQNYQSWYQFANDVHGRGVKPGQIMLVTGCDKTAEWALAAFEDKHRNAGISLTGSLPLATAQLDLTIERRWEQSNSAQHRTGPSCDVGSEIKFDQTVFIRGYKLLERHFLAPKVIKAAAEPRPPNPKDRDQSPDATQSDGSPGEVWSELVLETIPGDEPEFHPIDAILEHMISHSDSPVAVAHDDDWCEASGYSILEEYKKQFFSGDVVPTSSTESLPGRAGLGDRVSGVEETEGSVSSLKGHTRDQGKGRSEEQEKGTEVAGPSLRNERRKYVPQLRRRPTLHARYGVDVPALLPKEPKPPRDVRPDGISLSPNNAVIQRQSSELAALQRQGPFIRQSGHDDNQDADGSHGPFPRTVSGEPVPISPAQKQPSSSTKNTTFSSGHLPLNTPVQSPTAPHSLSPAGAPAPSIQSRVVTPSQRGLLSASASHLPLAPLIPSPTPRRPSIDSPRRPLVTDTPRRPLVTDTPRRPSVTDTPRRPSVDAPYRPLIDAPRRPSITSPPRSPLRPKVVPPSGLSVADSTVTSSAMSDTTSDSNLFTTQTTSTGATSETPSISSTKWSSINDELAGRRGMEPGAKYTRDRKSSEGHVVDLSRVVYATRQRVSGSKGHGKGKATEQEKAPPFRKAVWPINALRTHNQTRPASTKPQPLEQDEGLSTHPPISGPPPRRPAITGAPQRNDGPKPLAPFPRSPTHHARHSIDVPFLLPEGPNLPSDVSPDGTSLRPSNVMIRRESDKLPALRRRRPFVPQSGHDKNRDANDSHIRFPRTIPNSPAIHPSSADDQSANDKPRQPRGRFQSDVELPSSGRPNSYDGLGARPTQSRFENMVNLGWASGMTSASDLLSRDSLDGSSVRKALVIREEGKPPTHFQLGNCIGRGQFGSVYRALNLNTGQMVAVKRIRLEGLEEDEIATLMREFDLVKSLSHPSIVKYEGMTRDGDTLSIVLEYVENGSLGQTLKAFGKLNERLVAGYVVKILEGLHYLHQSDVVHCDLKAANILTTKTGNVKLSDFGVSLNLRAMQPKNNDVAGTPNWMAPEVIELKGASTKADIWSLACTVVELLTGRPPYAEKANGMSVMLSIVENDQPPIPEGCSPLLKDFLTQCFNKDPTKRPSADVLCEHPWLKKNWGAQKELRPQDSIPFLRRVSADLQKSEAVRFPSQIEMPEASLSESPRRVDDIISESPLSHRFSDSSTPPPDENISPLEHSFVKTTFSKPMVCRVCLLTVKRSAVLCTACSLISHSKCAINAPPTCDLRAQSMLYAQYAENSNPGSAYSNPMDAVNDPYPATSISDGYSAIGDSEANMSSKTIPLSGGSVAAADRDPTGTTGKIPLDTRQLKRRDRENKSSNCTVQ